MLKDEPEVMLSEDVVSYDAGVPYYDIDFVNGFAGVIEPHSINPEYYVFGTWLTNVGKHSRKKWFMPNPYQIKEDTPNKQWLQLIKKGLGIEKNLRTAKHKGADDKRRAGMDIKTICAIFGHSEEKMTERYMHSLKEERMEQARKIQLKEF